MLSEAVKLLWQMEEKGCLPDSITFNVIIQNLLKENEIHEAIQLLEEMRNRNFSPDEAVTSMLLCLASFDPQWHAALVSLPNALQKGVGSVPVKRRKT